MANKNPKNNQRLDRAANKKAGNEPGLSPEDKLIQVAKELRIKPKTKELYDSIINDKTITQGEAYRKLHPAASKASAAVNASKLLKSDKYHIYKASAVGKAKRRVVSLVDSRNERIALDASKDILDRVEGKAVTKQEITQKTVSVKLDLTGLKLGAHYVRPEVIAPILEEGES